MAVAGDNEPILPLWGRCPQGGGGKEDKATEQLEGRAPSAFPGLRRGRHLAQRGRITRIALRYMLG
ncbi:hypothetical protein CHU93_08250 [Sandarakinorhabdus cyanobacteriorum]|uniref:Uncharacterized protein n=1 Tax=Sandarakinorhabdus cyanobacteriorum TaxID=1981098 RepID=A0A255YHZ1_9SPHN|nr:hypothetical protein CHU93_08250 [Sandarakinorhabdus cyanobacteriorum]